MKNFLSVIILGSMSFNLVAQENNNSLNQSFSEIVYGQILNDLEVNIPIIVATPTLIGFMNISYVNHKMFFQHKPDTKKDVFSMSNYSTEQLFLELDNQFLGTVANGEDLLLTARFKDHILYTINLSKKENVENFKISSIDNSFSKTVDFNSGNFQQMTIIEPGNTTILTNKSAPNRQTEIYYQTLSSKYYIQEHQLSGELLMETITYKPTKNRDNKKVKNRIKYQYDNDGNLLSKVVYNKRDKKTDSLRYFYENGYLTAVKKVEKNSEGLIFLKTTQTRISRLNMKYNEKTINIEYEYNNKGKASRILITRNDRRPEDYRFLYNSKLQLISIDKYIETSDYNHVLMNKVNFDYYDNDMLKALILIDSKGNILKEVSYGISYL